MWSLTRVFTSNKIHITNSSTFSFQSKTSLHANSNAVWKRWIKMNWIELNCKSFSRIELQTSVRFLPAKHRHKGIQRGIRIIVIKSKFEIVILSTWTLNNANKCPELENLVYLTIQSLENECNLIEISQINCW